MVYLDGRTTHSTALRRIRGRLLLLHHPAGVPGRKESEYLLLWRPTASSHPRSLRPSSFRWNETRLPDEYLPSWMHHFVQSSSLLWFDACWHGSCRTVSAFLQRNHVPSLQHRRTVGRQAGHYVRVLYSYFHLKLGSLRAFWPRTAIKAIHKIL